MTTIKYHTKEEALEAIIEDSANELELCTPELQNDEEVVWEAIKKDSWAFEFASDILKNNKDFILKALNEGVDLWGLIANSNINIQSDLEIMSLAVEKSPNGFEFAYTQGEVALNKELAAEALVKWGAYAGSGNLDLWESIHLTLQEFFPKDCFYEKAKTYLHYLKQPKNVLGGCTDEDGVVW